MKRKLRDNEFCSFSRRGLFLATLQVIILNTMLLNTVLAASVESLIAEAKKAIVVIDSPSGQGSGVLIDSSGVIVTNLHVLENAADLSVKIHTGERFADVDVIDFDEVKDLALIKIKGFDLPRAILGNSNKVRAGQDVFAIGAPKGLEQTVSRGIVSAIRMMDSGFNSIQTDAAISDGSSGGGLFNQNGELVGILTAYRSDGQNLNFAVPINYARGMFGQPVRYTEEEFLLLNAHTPDFGQKLENAGNIGEIEGWLSQLDGEFEDLNISTYEDGKYGVIIGDSQVSVNLYGDLLWIGVRTGDERALTNMQLRKLLSLSLELDYAYYSLEGDQIFTNSELYLPGSDYSAFREVFLAVVVGYLKVEEDESLTLVETGSNKPQESQVATLPAIGVVKDRAGLREVTPGGLGVHIGFRAFRWSHTEDQGGVTFTSERGSTRYARLFVEEFQYKDDEAATVLTTTMNGYLESNARLEDVEKLEFGLRGVQKRDAISFRYSGFSSGIKIFWYTTLVIDGGYLVTLHTWDSKANWESMEEVTEEFLSAVRFP